MTAKAETSNYEKMKNDMAKVFLRYDQKAMIRKFANSHFSRSAGPHFPASQGHIKRSALEIGRARGAPPC